MSSLENLKKDIRTVITHWSSLDSNIKFLDMMTLASVGLFSFGFLYVFFLDVPIIVSNIAFMIFPAIVAGYIFILRSKLNDPEANHKDARNEFTTSILLITGLVLATFLYYLYLE